MAYTHTYRTYRFIDKDPIIDAMRVVRDLTGLKNHQAAELSGISPTTVHNWFEGGTRRPNNATVSAYTSALGYVRRDSIDGKGQLVVGFVKAKDLDVEKELERAADWLLKNPKKKKRNGAKK